VFAAAAVLLGLLAVAGTIWLRGGAEGAPFLLPPQDPADPRFVVPQSNAQFLEWLAAATALRIERHEAVGATQVTTAAGSSDRLDLEPWPETLHVDGGALADLKDAIRSSAAKTAAWAGIDVVLYVYLELPGDRTMRCFVNLGNGQDRFGSGVEGEEAIVPGARLTALLHTASAEIECRHRHAGGIALDLDELALLPAGSRHVTCPVPAADELVPRLARFHGLQSLRLVTGSGPQAVVLDDALLRELRQLERLEQLDIAAQPLTDGSLGIVAELPRLERLVLRGAGNRLAGAGFSAFHQRSLHEVTLHRCGGFDRSGMQALAKVPGLVALRFVDTPLGADLECLQDLPAFPMLHELAVRNQDLADRHLEPLLRTKIGKLVLVDAAVSGEGLAALAGLPSLKALELVTPDIGDDDVADLGRLQSLQRLVLRNVRITADGLGELRRALPRCEIDCLPGSRLFDTARVFER
jgi:hypothetical protein